MNKDESDVEAKACLMDDLQDDEQSPMQQYGSRTVSAIYVLWV